MFKRCIIVAAIMLPMAGMVAVLAWARFGSSSDRDWVINPLRDTEGAYVRQYSRTSDKYGRVDLIYPDRKYEIMAPSHKELAEKMKDRVKLRNTTDGSRMWFEAQMSDGRIEVIEGKKVERPPLPPVPQSPNDQGDPEV